MAVNQRRNFSDFCKKPMRSDKNRTSPIEIHSHRKHQYWLLWHSKWNWNHTIWNVHDGQSPRLKKNVQLGTVPFCTFAFFTVLRQSQNVQKGTVPNCTFFVSSHF